VTYRNFNGNAQLSRNIWAAGETVAKGILQMSSVSSEETKWPVLMKRNICLGMRYRRNCCETDSICVQKRFAYRSRGNIYYSAIPLRSYCAANDEGT